MLDRHDTIVACCTSPGVSTCAVIRVSGPAALSLGLDRYVPRPHAPRLEAFSPDPLQGRSSSESRRRGVEAGSLILPFVWHAALDQVDHAEAAVPVWRVVMPGPRSYTGEDVVEWIAPGSPAVTRALLRMLCAAERGDGGGGGGGRARLAEGGEFTIRALRAGRLDLGQAEAVERIVAAASETERRAALERLRHGPAARIDTARAALLALAAELETTLDFDEEELDEAVAEGMVDRLAAQAESLRGLAAAVAPERPAGAEVRVTLAGPVNAGKSSLFNALLGEARATVHPRPGATRDRLEAELRVDRWTLCLEDGPGFEPPFGSTPPGPGCSEDPVRPLAAARAAWHAGDAACLWLVCDGAEPIAPSTVAALGPSLPPTRVLLVINKADHPRRLDAAALAGHLRALPGVRFLGVEWVSALTGAGLERLRAHLRAEVLADAGGRSAGGISAREAAEVAEAADAAARAADALRAAWGAEVVVEELRAAHAALDRAQGSGYGEEVLAHVFGRFCIGK